MLEFPIEFFDDEIRDGFYVPSIMKHNWASQMEIVNTVDEICKKNNIKYYIFSGTLMGAVRHGGFIPWDDDIDICMLRKDYMRFIKAIMRDKPERYHVRNCHVEVGYRDVFTRLQNDDDVAFAPEFWRKGHGFICNAGIDVFPLDYIPTDPEKRKKISHDILQLCFVIKEYDRVGLSNNLIGEIEIVEKKHKVKVTRDETVPQQMYLLMEEILCSIKRSESKKVHISLDWVQSDDNGIPLECFNDTLQLPFETAMFSAPYLYDEVLKSMYGQYMRSVRVCDIHNYPWYQPVLDEIMKISLTTDYPYKCELLPEKNRHEKWLQDTENKLKETMELFNRASALAEKAFNSGDAETGNMLLAKCQALVSDAEVLDAKMKEPDRERVIFFTWKAEYWKYYQKYYEKEVAAGNEVLVVPVPYVRLTEIREQTDEYIDLEGFPEDIVLYDYSSIDYEEIRISRIYIQNPYDDMNGAVTVRPFFHSTSIREYTDELIYVPWFELDEYGEDDERAMYMMKYFAQVPGIVTSDRILLPKNQEWLKKHYVKYLTEWAGEDTKEIWEKKIIVSDWVEQVTVNTSSISIGEKKRLLYYVGLGQTLAAAEDMITKLRNNLEVFGQSSDKIIVNLVLTPGMIEKLKENNLNLGQEFESIINTYAQKEWCNVVNVESDICNDKQTSLLVEDNTAFYDDAGVLMHMFERAKKPVMMQSVMV